MLRFLFTSSCTLPVLLSSVSAKKNNLEANFDSNVNIFFFNVNTFYGGKDAKHRQKSDSSRSGDQSSEKSIRL